MTLEEIFLTTTAILYNYSIDAAVPRSKSKSIFRVDWALVMQIEHEKCLEKMICSHAHAQIEPILQFKDKSSMLQLFLF